MKSRLTIAIITGLALLAVVFTAGATPQPAAAEGTAPKIGVFLPDPDRPDEVLPTVDIVHNFESMIGRQTDVFLWYESIIEDFYDAELFSPLAAEGRVIQLSWEPRNPSGDSVNQPAYRLENITRGDFDTAIRRWARQIRDFGHTVLFRPMCEMNGNWTSWSGTVNGNTPDDYIPAWRHIHDIFVEEGAINAKFVWAPNRDGDYASAVSTWNTYYPGDAYVDYVGINGYNWGRMYTTPQWTSQWQFVDEIFGPSYDAFTARTSKPLVISETASTEIGGDKAAWITDAFARLPVRFPRIELITWFNINKETDWRVESSQASLNAFRAAVAPATPEPMALALDPSIAYWASYNDYVARELSVEFIVSNTGGSEARDVQIDGSSNTNGVTLLTGLPTVVGNLTAGGSEQIVMRYSVPFGTGDFVSYLTGSATDLEGNTHTYPE